ncbi:hypothetical protein [Klebsiella pneumoniae IS46]|nr:hypothetical protein [Klebsiella pneumoniae IS46]
MHPSILLKYYPALSFNKQSAGRWQAKKRRQRLFFLMPLIIIAFLIAVLHRRPGDFVRRLFAAGVIAPLVFYLYIDPRRC